MALRICLLLVLSCGGVFVRAQTARYFYRRTEPVVRLEARCVRCVADSLCLHVRLPRRVFHFDSLKHRYSLALTGVLNDGARPEEPFRLERTYAPHYVTGEYVNVTIRLHAPDRRERHLRLLLTDPAAHFQGYCFAHLPARAPTFDLTRADGSPVAQTYLTLGQTYRPLGEGRLESYPPDSSELDPPFYAVRLKRLTAAPPPDEVQDIHSTRRSLTPVHVGPTVFRSAADSGSVLKFLTMPPGYPALVDVQDSIAALELLLWPRELRALMQSPEPRPALRRQWTEMAKDTCGPEELQRIFYGRVAEANRFFSDVKHGWRTDRGQIFILFGPPDAVSVDYNAEIWYYAAPLELEGPLQFRFNRIEHPLTDHIFIVQRNMQLQPVWKLAVDRWLSGLVIE